LGPQLQTLDEPKRYLGTGGVLNQDKQKNNGRAYSPDPAMPQSPDNNQANTIVREPLGSHLGVGGGALLNDGSVDYDPARADRNMVSRISIN